MINKIDHIQSSIDNAINLKSKLDSKTLSIDGWTSIRIKHLLNNILEIPGSNYLEIGTFRGATFTSALFNNSLNSAYAIDNWSEFKTPGDLAKKEFLKNTKDLNFTYFEEDCWKVDLSKIAHKINVYLYDGAHTYQDQYNALTYYYPILDNEFIFMVDDFDPSPNWEQVEKGTRDSIKDLNLKILYENHLKSNSKNDSKTWWGGFYVSILQK
jgi:hypothetical protein